MAIQLNLPDPLYTNTSITATMTFANPDAPSVPVDPDTVTAQYLQGDVWTPLAYPATINKLEVGVYQVELPVTVAGVGRLTVQGTGACAITESAVFTALAPPGPPS